MNDQSFFDILKYLVKNNINPSLNYDGVKESFYIDLNTLAKSHLYLYEDGTLKGRYDYEAFLEEESLWDMVEKLCFHVKGCLHGRDFCNMYWVDLYTQFGFKN